VEIEEQIEKPVIRFAAIEEYERKYGLSDAQEPAIVDSTVRNEDSHDKSPKRRKSSKKENLETNELYQK
jgi:hypothetical protein